MSIHTAQYAALEKKDPKLQQIKNWALKDGDDRWGFFLGVDMVCSVVRGP
jgi:hypothetical protein